MTLQLKGKPMNDQNPDFRLDHTMIRVFDQEKH